PTINFIDSNTVGPSLSVIGLSGLNDVQTIELSVLQTGVLDIEDDVSLMMLSLPAFVTALGDIVLNNNTSLQIVDIPLLVPNAGDNFFANGCALTTATVDSILALYVANPGYVSGTLDLAGGTSSAPSSIAPG